MLIIERRAVARVEGIPVPITFYYYPQDPFAVTMVIHNGEEIVWKFDRELLCGGGEGDVKVAHAGSNSTGIYISSPGEGSAIFVFNRDDVIGFLTASYQMIPEGKESELIDWQEEFSFLQEG